MLDTCEDRQNYTFGFKVNVERIKHNKNILELTGVETIDLASKITESHGGDCMLNEQSAGERTMHASMHFYFPKLVRASAFS